MSPVFSTAELVLPYYAQVHLAEPAVTVLPFTLSPGVNLFITPEGTIAIPGSVRASLTTSATVANRVPVLRYVDADGNVLDEFASINSQVASQTGAYTWTPQVTAGYGLANISNLIPLQPIGLLAGWSLRLAIYQSQAGDLWTAGTTISYVRVPTGEVIETPAVSLSPLELPPPPAAPPAPSPGPVLLGIPPRV